MKGEYFGQREYYVEHIWFQHDKAVHRGSGVLRWEPEKGFRLIAQVKEETKIIKREVRAIDLSAPTRMLLEIVTRGGKITGITPKLRIDNWGLIFQEPFTINFRRIILLHDLTKIEISNEKWFGSAMYETNKRVVLPDIVHKETKLGDRITSESTSVSGFEYEGNDVYIHGEIEDEKYLYFNWSLLKSKWTKNESWRFGEALQDSLSIISGNIAKMRYHNTDRNKRTAIEFNAIGEPTSLEVIFRLFDHHFIPKDLVARLAIFLSKSSKKEQIIRNIYWQVVDAAKQNTESAKALLLSTVLEASLRTLYNLPFVPDRPSRDDPFQYSKIIKQFQGEYLSGEHETKWITKIEDAIEVYKRLRHRHAHPDWITNSGGMLSKPEIEQLINDLILLSRFYGYMILALSGEKNLEPKFPAQLSSWNPVWTVTTEE